MYNIYMAYTQEIRYRHMRNLKYFKLPKIHYFIVAIWLLGGQKGGNFILGRVYSTGLMYSRSFTIGLH